MLCNCKEEKKSQRIGILRSGNFHNPFQIAHIKIKDHFVSVFPQLVGYGKEISPQLLYVTSLTFALFSVPVIKCNILKSQSSEKKHKSSSHSCCLTPKTHAVFFSSIYHQMVPVDSHWGTPASLHFVPITQFPLFNYKNRCYIQLHVHFAPNSRERKNLGA